MPFFAMYQQPPLFFGVLAVVSLWSLVWKGLALWKAAQRKETAWFVFILVLNTAGILPIIYLLIRLDKPTKKSDPAKQTATSTTVVKAEPKKTKKKATKKKTSKKK